MSQSTSQSVNFPVTFLQLSLPFSSPLLSLPVRATWTMDVRQALSSSSPTARGATKALRQTTLQHRSSGSLSPSFSLSALLWHGAQQANALPGQSLSSIPRPRPGAPAHDPTWSLLFAIHRLSKCENKLSAFNRTTLTPAQADPPPPLRGHWNSIR